jgi:hypothetical protein
MQTSKFLVVLGAAAALVVPSATIAGPDTEAQAKLREAMRLKMEELNAQSAPVVAEPAPPAPKPVVVEEIKPVTRPPTVVVPVVEPAPVVVAPAPVAAPAVVPANSQFSDLPEDSTDAKNARLLESLRAQLAAEKAAKPATAVVVAPVASTPAPAPSLNSSPAPVIAVPLTANMEAPMSPLSGSKQDRLAELLRRYKIDEITPQEYHQQRAKIIAE